MSGISGFLRVASIAGCPGAPFPLPPKLQGRGCRRGGMERPRRCGLGGVEAPHRGQGPLGAPAGGGVRPHPALPAGLEPLQLVQSQLLTTGNLAAASAILLDPRGLFPSHQGGGSVSLRPSQACLAERLVADPFRVHSVRQRVLISAGQSRGEARFGFGSGI